MKDVQRIAIVDPSDATREPLRNLLLGIESVWLEAECSRYEFFIDVARQSSPDIVVVTLDSDHNKALHLIQQLTGEFAAIPILAVSAVKTIEANYPWLRAGDDSAARELAQRYLDRVLNPWYLAGVRRLQRERKDAEILSIPGHHFIFITAQHRVAHAVLEFLGRLRH